MRVNRGVRLLSNKKRKFGGLLNSSETQQSGCPRGMNDKQHRIVRAEPSCDIGCIDRAGGVAGVAMHECESEVSRRVMGAQADRLIERAGRAFVLALKPQCTAHRPMCRRIARVGLQSLSGGFKCQSNLVFLRACFEDERVLKMRK